MEIPQFDSDQDGFPMTGQVVRYFRYRMSYTDKTGKVHSWTQAQLAKKLDVSERVIRDMEAHNKYMDSIDRRRLLSKLLNIPPALLGLATLDQLHNIISSNDTGANAKQQTTNRTRSISTNEEVQLYRDTLPVFKSSYDSSELQAATIETWIKRIASNKPTNDVLEMLVAYHVLAGRLYTHDSAQWQKAMQHMNAAIQLAARVNSTELSTYAHHHKAEMFLIQKNLFQARDEIEHAVSLASNINNPQVAGRVFTYSALIHAMTGSTDADTLYVQKQLQRAEKCVGMQGDQTFMMFDKGQFLIDKADTLISLGLYPQAYTTLNDYVASSSADNKIRRKSYLQILQAELAIKQRKPEYELATDTLSSVLEENSGIQYYRDYVSRLLKLIRASNYGNAPDVVELMMQLRKWR